MNIRQTAAAYSVTLDESQRFYTSPDSTIQLHITDVRFDVGFDLDGTPRLSHRVYGFGRPINARHGEGIMIARLDLDELPEAVASEIRAYVGTEGQA